MKLKEILDRRSSAKWGHWLLCGTAFLIIDLFAALILQEVLRNALMPSTTDRLLYDAVLPRWITYPNCLAIITPIVYGIYRCAITTYRHWEVRRNLCDIRIFLMLAQVETHGVMPEKYSNLLSVLAEDSRELLQAVIEVLPVKSDEVAPTNST